MNKINHLEFQLLVTEAQKGKEHLLLIASPIPAIGNYDYIS